MTEKCKINIQNHIGEEYGQGERIEPGQYFWVKNCEGKLVLDVRKYVEYTGTGEYHKYIGDPPRVPLKPKDGEWWMCRDKCGIKCVYFYGDKEWQDSRGEPLNDSDIEPLFRMVAG